MDSKVSVSAFNKPKKKVRWPVSGNSNPKSYGTIPDHNDSSSDESDYHPRDTIVPRNKKLYGEVEFHGAGHKTRAKFVRLKENSSPSSVWKLLCSTWDLGLPKLIISVVGGKNNFKLSKRLQDHFKLGLWKVSETTGAWVITGGTNTGISKLIGESLKGALRIHKETRDRNKTHCIGIVTWGSIRHREDLEKINEQPNRDIATYYLSLSKKKVSDNAYLNNNHTHFLLVDDGTSNQFWKEIQFRNQLEDEIRRMVQIESGVEDFFVPMVLLVAGGGLHTIKSVKKALLNEPRTPVILLAGSGRAADVLAFALNMPDGGDEALYDMDVLMEHNPLMDKIEVEYSDYTHDQHMELYQDIVKCIKIRKYITVCSLGRGQPSLDQTILKALLKCNKDSHARQLYLALLWNHAKIAQKEIFGRECHLDMAALEEIMTTALKTNKVKFVEVLMENGVSMGRYLTVRRLENLYREAAKKPKTIMNHLLGVNELQDFTIDDIGMILTEICGIDLMKDLGNTIGLNKDTGTHKFSVVAGLRYSGMQLESFDRPYNALFIWAVLNNLQEMAMLFWQEGCEILSHALIACKLYKRMSDIATRMGLPDEIADEMDRNGREFEDLSVSLLDHCYNTDEKRARHLLTYELKHWGKLTSLILAADAEHEEFVAHSCCQTLLTSIWKGALKLKTNESLKTIACLAFPPLVLALDFCSERELYENVLTRDRHKDRNKMPSKQTNQYAEENPDMVLLNFEGHVIEVSHQRESDDFKKRNGKRASFIIPSEKPFLDERSRDDPGTLKWWQKYREFYSAPITKFWMNVTVYIVFLMMFIYVVLVKLGPWPTVQEWIVIVLIVSFTTEEFRQLLDTEASTFKEKLRDWSASVWNLLDSVAILFFYVGLFLRFQSNPNTVLIGHAIYAIDVMLWIIRLLDIFSVNRYLGPYVVMIGRMTIDLAYFLFVMVIFFIAYGVGRQAILEPQAQASWRALRDMSYIPFLQIFGELQVEKFEGKESNKTVFGTQVRTPYGESITIVLMGIYLLIVNVLLLNLLIAVFNNTYSEIQAKSKKVWKFTRYHIIMEYTFRPALLPPFVIFSHLYAFLIYICSKFHCLKCCRKLCKFPKHSRAVLKSTMRESELRDLRTFEEECLTNMMRKRELIIEGTQDEKLDSMTHSISSVKEKIETIGDENWAREERQKNGIQVILSKFNELENEREGITSTMNALQETLGSCFETIRGLKEESSRVKTQLAQSQNELEKLSTSIKEHKWQEEHSSPHDGSPEELHADESLVKRSHEEASPADTNEGVKMTVRTLPKRTQPRAASVSPKSTEPKEPIKVEANSDLPLKKDSTPYLIDWNLVSGTEDMPQIREQAVIASQSDSDDETEDSNEHKEVEKQSEKEDEEIKEISEREPVYYPLSTVERFPVTDTSVSWEVGYPEYDPQNYTSEIVLSGPSWADPDLTSENAVAFKFNETDENADRRSFEGMYDVVEGFPRNPRGRTGVKGRGNLGRWGPNHMVELFITRWKQSKGGLKILRGGKRVLEILAMKTKAESELALPSGMVKAGEQLPVLIGKVFSADAVNRLQLGQPLKDKMKEELALIFQHGKELFKGYSEDERNTDNAWVEILITNYHDEEGDVFRHFPVKGYIGSTNLYWQEVSGNIALGNWHKSLLLEVAKTLDAHF